jgi:hypothetical protein
MNVTVLDDYTSPPTTTNDQLRATGKATRIHRLVGHPPCRDDNTSATGLPLCTHYEASREGTQPVARAGTPAVSAPPRISPWAAESCS